MENYASSNDETYSDEKPAKAKKTVIEDTGSETSALVQQDSGDMDADKHKGCKLKNKECWSNTISQSLSTIRHWKQYLISIDNTFPFS